MNYILDLSKIEAGRLEVQRTSCSPGQVIAEVVSLLRARALEKGLRLDARCAGGVKTRIETDPDRLRQLLMNLVGNSVKFTERGSVEIEGRFVVEENRHWFRIEVTDSGIGIPAERLETIFEPFVQTDNSVTRKHGGTGLALSIRRRIAEALGGRLQARSELGVGTTFTADIDPGEIASDGPPAQLASVEVVRPQRQLGGATAVKLFGNVLIVEDGDTNRKLVTLVLRRAGANGRLREQLTVIRQRQADEDWEAMGRIAHWLKGAGGTVGFPLLSARAAELEQAIKRRSSPDVAIGIAELESLAARIVIERRQAVCP